MSEIINKKQFLDWKRNREMPGIQLPEDFWLEKCWIAAEQAMIKKEREKCCEKCRHLKDKDDMTCFDCWRYYICNGIPDNFEPEEK